MFAMLEAKFPPPKPHSKARTTKVAYGVFRSCTAMPMPMVGRSSRAVLMSVQFLPPQTGTIKA